jgi:hypothetical protein
VDARGGPDGGARSEHDLTDAVGLVLAVEAALASGDAVALVLAVLAVEAVASSGALASGAAVDLDAVDLVLAALAAVEAVDLVLAVEVVAQLRRARLRRRRGPRALASCSPSRRRPSSGALASGAAVDLDVVALVSRSPCSPPAPPWTSCSPCSPSRPWPSSGALASGDAVDLPARGGRGIRSAA